MTNLPTGTTETTPTTTRRRLNRVITVSALAAGALAALAVPAQATTVHHGGGSAAVGVRVQSDPRDCGDRQRDNGGRRRFAMSGYYQDSYGSPSCGPTGNPTAPVNTPVSTPSTPVRTPTTTTSPSSTVTTRGATINYNEGYAGSCVFYALDRFHQYTGVYPKAFGDARYLATGAAASGWATGTTPRINSLVVFQPGQNGAGSPTGHVAWVEQVSGNQIYVSEMNAPTAYVVSRRWLTPVAGVRYVYA